MNKKAEPAKQLNQKKADFYVKVVLSSFEAALIRKMRRFEFGTFVVTKQYGEPRKCDVQESDFLEESEGEALQVDSLLMEEEIKNRIKGSDGEFSNN